MPNLFPTTRAMQVVDNDGNPIEVTYDNLMEVEQKIRDKEYAFESEEGVPIPIVSRSHDNFGVPSETGTVPLEDLRGALDQGWRLATDYEAPAIIKKDKEVLEQQEIEFQERGEAVRRFRETGGASLTPSEERVNVARRARGAAPLEAEEFAGRITGVGTVVEPILKQVARGAVGLRGPTEPSRGIPGLTAAGQSAAERAAFQGVGTALGYLDVITFGGSELAQTLAAHAYGDEGVEALEFAREEQSTARLIGGLVGFIRSGSAFVSVLKGAERFAARPEVTARAIGRVMAGETGPLRALARAPVPKATGLVDAISVPAGKTLGLAGAFTAHEFISDPWKQSPREIVNSLAHNALFVGTLEFLPGAASLLGKGLGMVRSPLRGLVVGGKETAAQRAVRLASDDKALFNEAGQIYPPSNIIREPFQQAIADRANIRIPEMVRTATAEALLDLGLLTKKPLTRELVQKAREVQLAEREAFQNQGRMLDAGLDEAQRLIKTHVDTYTKPGAVSRGQRGLFRGFSSLRAALAELLRSKNKFTNRLVDSLNKGYGNIQTNFVDYPHEFARFEQMFERQKKLFTVGEKTIINKNPFATIYEIDQRLAKIIVNLPKKTPGERKLRGALADWRREIQEEGYKGFESIYQAPISGFEATPAEQFPLAAMINQLEARTAGTYRNLLDVARDIQREAEISQRRILDHLKGIQKTATMYPGQYYYYRVADWAGRAADKLQTKEIFRPGMLEEMFSGSLWKGLLGRTAVRLGGAAALGYATGWHPATTALGFYLPGIARRLYRGAIINQVKAGKSLFEVQAMESTRRKNFYESLDDHLRKALPGREGRRLRRKKNIWEPLGHNIEQVWAGYGHQAIPAAIYLYDKLMFMWIDRNNDDDREKLTQLEDSIFDTAELAYNFNEEAGANAAMSYVQARNFLKTKYKELLDQDMPADAPVEASRIYSLSDKNKLKMVNYLRAAFNPEAVYDDLLNEKVLPETREVLETLYPDFYEQVQDEISQFAEERNLSTAAQMQLGTLFGSPISEIGDPINMSIFSSVMGYNRQEQPGQRPTGPPIRPSTTMATTSQRIAASRPRGLVS